VLVIGGLAVIAHGHNRSTKDADIWLEPMDSPADWAKALVQACEFFPGATIHSLPGWREVCGTEIAIAAEEVGMVRIQGLDCPLYIFREPNEFPPGSFDEVYERATPNIDGTRLPDPLDIIVTKLNTDRAKDLEDSRFLESVIRERYRGILPTAPLVEVQRLLDRFLDWEVCAMALSNPAPEVKDYAARCLRELAADGDPFSKALLERENIPYS
jgi:hypothetical protein